MSDDEDEFGRIERSFVPTAPLPQAGRDPPRRAPLRFVRDVAERGVPLAGRREGFRVTRLAE